MTGQWLRHCATSREVAGSRQMRSSDLFNLTNPSRYILKGSDDGV
jgi:hypothetical protein